ncbi:MAG: hypothetical protein NTW75_06185 [Planctomycetales bacterium]|nr:hypothetical protein [Planctomycetales bacterium]
MSSLSWNASCLAESHRRHGVDAKYDCSAWDFLDPSTMPVIVVGVNNLTRGFYSHVEILDVMKHLGNTLCILNRLA